jgi:hypothetical protein
MKNLFLLNRLGFNPDVTCRKSRHAIESIVSRFSLASLICTLLLTIGIGNVWGAEVVVYTLDPAIGGSNGYATLSEDIDCEDTDNDVTIRWNAIGNTTLSPWRIGGKNITNEVRPIYSETAISDNVTKVVVTHGTYSLTAGATVILNVYSTAAAAAAGGTTNRISSVSGGTITANKVITFSRPTGHNWTGRFFRFEYTCSAGNSNKFVEFSQADFYAEAGGGSTPSVTPDPTSLDWGTVLQGSSQDDKTFSISGSNLTGNLSVAVTGGYSVSCGSSITVTSGTPNVTTITVTPPSTSTTGTKNGTVTISGGGLASNVVVNLSMTVNAASTVTWMNNGSEYTTTPVENGSKPTFPATPTSCDDESTTFYGWATDTWSGKTDDISGETIYTSADAMPTVSGPVTYHAVFAKGSAGTVVLNEEFDNETTADASTAISSSKFSNFSGETSKAYTSKYGGIKLGSSGNAGYITSKSLNLSSAFIVSIDACKYGSQATDIQVTVGSTTKTISRDDMNADGTYKTHVLSFGAATSTSTVKIGTSGERAYIDNVVITTAGTATDYMTTCAVCDYKVNISKGGETNGTFVLSRSGEQATCDGGRVITVTPTPADHYRVASVTASAPSGAGSQGTATVTGPVNGVYTVTYSNEAKGNSTVNVVFEAIPQHTITLVPAAPANGTTSLKSAGTTSVTIEEGTIVNLRAIPNDCYSVSSITITPSDGYTELEDAGDNDYHITGITKNLSVAVVYAQRAQYTVTLDAGSGSVAGSTSITQSNCGNITLPTASPSDACATDGWEFAGWSRTKVNIETTSAPVLIPASSFAPTATETLYAVYKQGSGAAESYWIKVYDDNQLAVGDSVIIAADITAEQDYALSTTQNNNNRAAVAITRSVTGDTLTTPIGSTVAKLVLQSGTTSGTWAFYDANLSGYLYAAGSGSNNYLRTQTTKDANSSWEITLSSITGVATIEAQGSNTNNLLKKNNTSALFSCYGSGQKAICLYKRYSAETNSYTSVPSCIPCTSSGASLSSTSVSMTTGKSTIVSLASANTSAVSVTSEDPTIATVSISGKDITINGIKEGETTIVVEQARDALDESAHCEVYLEIHISVTTSTIEIIEWEPNAVIIEYDGADDANLVLGKEVEHGSKEGTVATELFFSKYFEAAGQDKLLGIYNGTSKTIDLTDYFIWTKGFGTTLQLSNYGATKGKIAPKEEIIIYRYGQTGYSRECMDTVPGHETWNEITWEGMQFSGRHSIGLYRKDKSGNDSIIDIIGATYYDKANPNDYDPDLVILDKNDDGGISPSWGDESGFNAEGCGDNIRTKNDIETNYGLSTNRCLLIRRNTVTSGANAIAKDTLNADSTASAHDALAAASFKTLCEEWVGYHIIGKASLGKDSTCKGMSEVAGFDYSNYYVTMETFSDETTIGDYANGDGTYTLPIPHLDTLACRLVRIQLAKDGNVIASSDPQVPIIVTTDKSTNDALFNQHSIDTCKVCDVVVRDKAKLTKAANGAANDRAELNTITVYSGSQLIVPSGATNMKINNLILRSLEDTVSTASFAGGIQFKGAGNKVYHSKRVKQDRWYWFCLPHACSTSKVTWQDGTKATIGKDFHLKYYDGAQRAATQQGGCWKEYTGSTIQPGVGYILSVEQRVGHTYRELIFPMDTISEGETPKGVPVDDYGAGEAITPNHKGWNLVGNPYMTYYQKNKINAGDKNLPALTVGKLIPHDSIDAENPLRTIHTYTIDVSGGNNAPFITIPVNSGNSEYQQQAIMDYDLPPFMSYFVQIGNNTPVSEKQYVNFYKTDLTNSATNLLHAPAARKQQEDEQAVQIEPVWITLRMKNHEQEADETTFIISDQYSADYEIGSDLGKWFGDNYKDYTKPVLYSKANDGDKLVFYSLPDASAEQWIPLGFWGGNVTQPITFSLRRNNRKLDYVKSVMLHDKTQNTYTELLENDYQFAPGSQTKLNGSRFEVKVLLERPKNVPTGLGNIHEGLYAYANGSQLVVVGLPEQASVWIYDAVGHLIASEATVNYMRTYTMPAQGVYFVRVNSAAGQQTLRTIVK